MSQLLSGLNPQQHEAVTLPLRQPSGEPQSALVLAGAGSGKTRVLTTRMAYLIQTGQAAPHGLMAVTFTNKAAREMLIRLSAMLPIHPRGMWVGTFHGLCNRLLRAHCREAGLPALFQILDSQDQLAFVKRLLKGLRVDEEKVPPRELQYFINAAKEQGLRAPQVEVTDERSRRMVELYAAYDEQCNREGVVDFAELLLRAYELFCREPMLAEHYRNRFAHILVDEFQDTNRLQYLWLKHLAGRDRPVFAVGDDDQSIYAFRGACAENMRDFERDYPGYRLIKLEQNYRSAGNILAAANAVIKHNRHRLGKNLWTTEGEGEPLRLYEALTDQEEAQFVVEEVRALRREGVPYSDMAVLYRSNAQSRVLEHALFSAGVPYRVYGGLRFFERQEVKHALAYLRLAANPGDDGALERVINFPARGIGARTLEQLRSEAAAAGLSLWEAVRRRVEARGQKPEGTRKGIEGFVALIDELRTAASALSLPELVQHAIEASGLAAHYRAEREGEERLANLDELINAASAFVQEAEEHDLTAFLAHAALEAGEHQAASGAEALQLMTVHSAKGLEFHAVFVTGLEEGLFPHEQSLLDPGGVEEERRLMYVALTRARRRLYLSLAHTRMLHGQTRYNVPSRFLREVPAELVRSMGGAGIVHRAPSAPAPPPASSWPQPAFRLADGPQWYVGQSVLHPKFGRGVIVNCEGRGPDARVQVRFSDAGLKWLALEYAKLTPAH
ncbi:3'-5' exonuclease [Pelomicrobium sp.]|jgi:DNA helicase-2/ATP-dependent DNA helicase PcrA|uniref:3'-5' exonuclease n=1 Tax=Pelomicrobium sp. TaxID=2815319 RepID=UPI002FDDC53B